MKKITLFLAVLLVTVSSFANGKPDYTGSFSDRHEVRKFVREKGKQILGEGKFKYFNVKITIPIDTAIISITVEVYGTNEKPFAEWGACGQVYYGASTNNTNLYAAADAAFAMYESQGYNCICTVESNNEIYGDFTGHQSCMTVTAIQSTLCPCLM